MIKTIVVPLDGSAEADAALAPATFLATELGIPLHLMTTTFAAELDVMRQHLEAKAAELRDRGAEAVVDISQHHFPERGILDVADEVPSPVVCMTTHARSALGSLLLGSVADTVAEHLTCPVLLVGPHVQAPDPSVRRLVLCWDRSDVSSSIEATATEWAEVLGLEVWLVTVREPADLRSNEPVARLHEELGAIAGRLRGQGLDVHTTVLEAEDAATAVVELADEVRATFVAAATHGRGGVASTALGKVATKIVRHSPCPVLVQRPAL